MLFCYLFRVSVSHKVNNTITYHTHIYMHAYILTYRHTDIQTYIQTYTHTHIHTHTHTHTHMLSGAPALQSRGLESSAPQLWALRTAKHRPPRGCRQVHLCLHPPEICSPASFAGTPESHNILKVNLRLIILNRWFCLRCLFIYLCSFCWMNRAHIAMAPTLTTVQNNKLA
jgi:hypothetical protein